VYKKQLQTGTAWAYFNHSNKPKVYTGKECGKVTLPAHATYVCVLPANGN
jgi:hypothetical protein